MKQTEDERLIGIHLQTRLSLSALIFSVNKIFAQRKK